MTVRIGITMTDFRDLVLMHFAIRDGLNLSAMSEAERVVYFNKLKDAGEFDELG